MSGRCFSITMTPLYLLGLLWWIAEHAYASSVGETGCRELSPPFYGSLIHNGSLVAGEQQPTWRENDTVTFVCEKGYLLLDPSERALGSEWSVTCEAREMGSGSGSGRNSTSNSSEVYWTWNREPEQLRCSRVDCGQPSTISNGSVSFNSTELFSIAQYTCSSGYQLTGEAGYSVCWWDGVWRPDNISCTALPPAVVCTDPPTVTNGDRTWLTGDTATVGTTVAYTCDAGYDLDGATLIACDNTGQWTDPPTCTASAVLSSTEVYIIEGAVGVVFILLLSIALCFVSCLLCRIRTKQRQYIEDEEALANSGAFTLSNPLVSIKDEDAAGNPLYLTPDELNEFEQKQ